MIVNQHLCGWTWDITFYWKNDLDEESFPKYHIISQFNVLSLRHYELLWQGNPRWVEVRGGFSWSFLCFSSTHFQHSTLKEFPICLLRNFITQLCCEILYLLSVYSIMCFLNDKRAILKECVSLKIIMLEDFSRLEKILSEFYLLIHPRKWIP